MDHMTPVRCWRCADTHSISLFCPHCQAIQQLPPEVDYFAVFGLPRNPVIDEAALAPKYYDLSRRLHPDLYQTGTAEEKEASLQNTAILNRAYRTLRDLVQRGQYWLELQGEQLGRDNNRVLPALAALVFEVQEKLAEARDNRAEGKGEAAVAELAPIRAEVQTQLERSRATLADNLTQWSDGNGAPALLQQLKACLSEIAYLRTLLRDVDKESETSWNG
jgi:molecular chaperone HscB